jgi:adenylate cyclase class 2
MQLEVEIKAYADDLNSVKDILEANGAELIADQLEIDDYYAHPVRDFGITDEALRLRTIQSLSECATDRAEFTYKGPKIDDGSKTREEYTETISDPGSMVKILENLGFTLIREVRKQRTLYKFKEFTVCLDDIEGLGTFVEIEKIIESKDGMESVLADMRAVLNEQFSLTRFERRSYLELLMENDI